MSISDRDCILAGLDEIEKRIRNGEFVWRADREDVHMNIEAALTDLIGEPAKKLHTARSRNDQVATDFRLWCRDAIDSIIERIKDFQVAMVDLAIKNKGIIVPGYTHLQRAQPVLLQHLLLAFVEQVLNYCFSSSSYIVAEILKLLVALVLLLFAACFLESWIAILKGLKSLLLGSKSLQYMRLILIVSKFV